MVLESAGLFVRDPKRGNSLLFIDSTEYIVNSLANPSNGTLKDYGNVTVAEKDNIMLMVDFSADVYFADTSGDSYIRIIISEVNGSDSHTEQFDIAGGGSYATYSYKYPLLAIGDDTEYNILVYYHVDDGDGDHKIKNLSLKLYWFEDFLEN